MNSLTKVHKLTFNPFNENTYIIEDKGTKECIIIDPGCYGAQEEQQLRDFIEENDLQPQMLLNTHCHLDHVFGNAFVHKTFGCELWIHEAEIPILNSFESVCAKYQIPVQPTIQAQHYFDINQPIKFADVALDLLLCPGHSPGSICFYQKEDNFIIGGDVLFYESIGRTDLPLGNHGDLLESIGEKLYQLPEETLVYPGHGPNTSIGYEKKHNPFVRA